MAMRLLIECDEKEALLSEEGMLVEGAASVAQKGPFQPHSEIVIRVVK
jgi:hypothetical protein